MQKPRALLFFIAAAVWLAVPIIAAAQGTLVPCDGLSCDLCSVGQLMQNIVNFLIFFSLFIAVVMFAYAGFLYVTATGDPGRIKTAHALFKDVLIGFLIAISAWLVVQTVISVMFDGDAFVGSNWYTLECSDPKDRLMNTNIGQLFGSVIPGTTAPTGTGGGTGGDSSIDTSGGTASGSLVNVVAFECKNSQSCQVPSTVNLQLEEMRTTLGAQASQYQITETGVNTTVNHASGSNNLDMSCRGICSGSQVKAVVDSWSGRVQYETNSQEDYNAKRSAGVPASNMLLLTGRFDSAGNCSAGTGKCITAPHMSLYP